MFGFKKKNETWTARAEDVAGCEEAYKKTEDKVKELDEKLKPFREIKSKGLAVITSLYKRHGIEVKTFWYGIDDAWLDFEVIKDLCIFNDQELASLKKWIPKYKEAQDTENKMILNFSREPN